MKNLILFLLFTTFTTSLFSQELDWVNIAYGPGQDVILDIANDLDNNIYSIGYFEKELYLNEGKDVLTAKGKKNIFIQKISQEGKLLWKQSYGDENYAAGKKIRVNTNGESYILGTFSKEITIQDTTLIPVPGKNTLLVKFNPDGFLIWAKRLASSYIEKNGTLEIDEFNNVYVSGQFSGEANFGDAQNPHILKTESNVTTNLFIAKYNSQDQLEWVNHYEKEKINFSTIKVKDKIVYLGGSFTGIVDFDLSDEENILDSYGNGDAIILKLDTNGDFNNIFQIRGRSSSGIGINSLAIDNDFNIYTSISFLSEINIEYFSFKSLGSRDAVVTKLDTSGMPVWAKHFSSESDIIENSLGLDQLNNIYLIGTFRKDMILSPKDSNSVVLHGNIFPTTYYTILNQNGDLQSLQKFGNNNTIGELKSQKILIDRKGNIIMSGSFQDKVDLNPDEDKEYNVMSADDFRDSYIIKIKQNILGTKTVKNSSLTCYPNPVTDYLHFDQEKVINQSYKIFNLYGATIKEGEINDNFIYLGTLPKGIYFLEFEEMGVIKIIKN